MANFNKYEIWKSKIPLNIGKLAIITLIYDNDIENMENVDVFNKFRINDVENSNLFSTFFYWKSSSIF